MPAFHTVQSSFFGFKFFLPQVFYFNYLKKKKPFLQREGRRREILKLPGLPLDWAVNSQSRDCGALGGSDLMWVTQ